MDEAGDLGEAMPSVLARKRPWQKRRTCVNISSIYTVSFALKCDYPPTSRRLLVLRTSYYSTTAHRPFVALTPFYFDESTSGGIVPQHHVPVPVPTIIWSIIQILRNSPLKYSLASSHADTAVTVS